MHGLSNDVARIAELADGSTWQSSAISELDLAVSFIVLALVLIPYANRTGWGDLRPIPSIKAVNVPEGCRARRLQLE